MGTAVMTERIAEESPRLKARIAGVLYLLAILMGIASILVHGRLGFVAYLTATSCNVAVALLFYGIFKPVNRSLSFLATFFGLVGSITGAFKWHPQGVDIGMVFFGSYCLLTGYLIFQSTFLPRILGALMAFAGLAWLSFLSEPLTKYLSPYNMAPGIVGQVSLTLWLLVMGVNVQRWKEQAKSAVRRTLSPSGHSCVDTTMRRAAARSNAMAQIGTEYSSTERTQRIYARVAGFLLLWLIVTGLAGMLTISHIVGSGTFAETVKRVVASEHLYRAALCSALIETLSTVLLAFALYVTLKPVDKLLAQVAMYCRLGEAFIGGAGMIFDYVKLRLYTSPQSLKALGIDQSQALVDLTRAAGFASYNISAIFFSIGSILFCYLFFRSRYIPRVLSAFGVFASVIVTIICFGSLIFPEHAGTLQYGWAPMAIAEVTTGIWLMVFAVKTQARSDQPSARPAVIRS